MHHADVYLDGDKIKDKTPLTISTVYAGKHTIKVQKHTYHNKELSIEILHNKTRRLEIFLEPIPCGRLYVKTKPERARVMILNIQSKFHQGIELEPGRYHIEVSKTGYKSEKIWIELGSREEKKVNIGLVAAYISVLGAKVRELRFFESDGKAPPYEQRVYRKRFAKSDTKFINWELLLEHPAPGRPVNFSVKAVWHRNQGSFDKTQTRQCYVAPNWTSSCHSYGFGWRDKTWKAGSYELNLYVGGEKVAVGSFEIY
jgi:hypothetical protein